MHLHTRQALHVQGRASGVAGSGRHYSGVDFMMPFLLYVVQPSRGVSRPLWVVAVQPLQAVVL
jgi:hypothetical protein